MGRPCHTCRHYAADTGLGPCTCGQRLERWAAARDELVEAAAIEGRNARRLLQVSDDGFEWLIELGFQLEG